MLRRFFAAIGIAILAFFLSRREPEPLEAPPPIQGRNNTILFLTTEASGLSNVHIAASSALLEHYPHIELHYASFPKLASKVSRISTAARSKNPLAMPISWHELPGPSFLDIVLNQQSADSESLVTPKGAAGINKGVEIALNCMAPWTPEEHWHLYSTLADLIDTVDPALVVLDIFFRPAMDLVANVNRRYALLCPNSPMDVAGGDQPWAASFWKYPAVSSGHAYPVPWSKIPANAYMLGYFIWKLVTSPKLQAKREYLTERGIQTPHDMQTVIKGVPWLLTTVPEAHIPMPPSTPEITFCGVTAIDEAPAAEQDPELAKWMTQAPTVLVNLGSLVHYNEQRAAAMAEALQALLTETRVQVLWKFRKMGDYGDEVFEGLQPHIKEDRLRLLSWINADPLSLLNTGNIVLSVHHGGANCYNEAVLAGVPQLILPLWLDLYSFAVTAEYLGIGIWPGKDTAPEWDGASLADGFLKATTGQTSIDIRQKARVLGEVARKYGGSKTAAGELAKLAAISV